MKKTIFAALASLCVFGTAGGVSAMTEVERRITLEAQECMTRKLKDTPDFECYHLGLSKKQKKDCFQRPGYKAAEAECYAKYHECYGG
jgi:hypothetical protein